MIEKRFTSIETHKNKSLYGYALKHLGLTFVEGIGYEMFLPNAFSEKRTDLCLEHGQKISEAEVSNDSIGLKFTAKISPEIAEKIKQQDLKGASVGFQSLKEHRNSRGERVIESGKLIEISLTANPSYKNSHLEVRKENDLWKFENELLLLELEV